MRTAVFAAICLAAAQQNPQKEQLKTLLKDTEVAAGWIYDDLPTGVAEAKKTGKPLLIAFR